MNEHDREPKKSRDQMIIWQMSRKFCIFFEDTIDIII